MSYNQIIESLKRIDCSRTNKLANFVGRLKNTFMTKNQKADNFVMMYSDIMPSVWVEYTLNGRKQYTHVKDYAPNSYLLKKPEDIIAVYQSLYSSVPISDEPLMEFALEKAIDLKKSKQFTY